MRNFIIKRLLLSVLILFCVTFIIYVLLRCLPASYVENMAMRLSTAPGSKPYEEWVAQLNAQYALDLDIIPGYFVQLKNMLTGNFGDSWRFTVPVIQKFSEVIWISVIMGGIALILELLIAIPLGIMAATKQYSRADYAITAGALVGISLPTFFFATILKLIFAVKLKWFDVSGLMGRNYAQLDQLGKMLDMAHHLVLPIVTLTIVSVGSLMRYTRTNMLEVLNADYIRTARAKGCSEKRVIWKHALKNASLPIITLLLSGLATTLGGSVVVEQIFTIPGVGMYLLSAVNEKNVPVVMTCALLLSFIFMLAMVLLDICYALIDPKIGARYKK